MYIERNVVSVILPSVHNGCKEIPEVIFTQNNDWILSLFLCEDLCGQEEQLQRPITFNIHMGKSVFFKRLQKM